MKNKFVVIILIVLLAAFVVCGVGSSWFTNLDVKTWFKDTETENVGSSAGNAGSSSDTNKNEPSGVPTTISVKSSELDEINNTYSLVVGKTYSFEIVQDNANHSVSADYKTFEALTTATGKLTVGYYEVGGRGSTSAVWSKERVALLSEFKDDIISCNVSGNTLSVTLNKTISDYYSKREKDSSSTRYYDKVKSIDSECYFKVFVYNTKLGPDFNYNFKVKIATDTSV